jgi:methylenetetrahydrofolate reductase (NADPH)
MSSNALELSYEFFPPRTDAGKQTLARTRLELASLSPEFFSVTFGAGGSTRDKTLDTVIDIQQNSPVDACPHITCVGANNDEIIELLEIYQSNNIHRLLVLRGDPPSGMVGMGDCKNAKQLLELVRSHFGDQFILTVAAYPEAHPDAKDLLSDVEYFVQKMNAGADSAITQYFYNNDSYYHFMDLCTARGIEQPVYPGIMPISNFNSLKRFSKQCGAEIPRWIKKSMAAFEDGSESQRQLGLDIVTRQCEQLIENGAPGLHFYTMNQSALTATILQNLNLINT